MVISDIWGQIRIEPKYEKIINSKEFRELKNRNQLGLNSNVNAIHTRYQHSIGTYYLALMLTEIAKSKFSDILSFTSEDEDALKCMALVHDLGHGPFSHVSEEHLVGTHENRTEQILLDENSEINSIIKNEFGDVVLDKIVNLIRMKEKIKENGKVKDENNLSLIMSKLLSGGIDIDRIDYIYRDSKHATGEINDFSKILECIDIECIDDSLEIVFDESAEFSIANFFNKRYELYDTLYLENKTRIIESIFGKFLNITNTKLEWDTTEIEINNAFRENTSNSNEVIKRYAEILSVKQLDSGFILKEINNANTYNLYKNKLLSSVEELNKYDSCFLESKCNMSIYNKDNKIFVDKSGLIMDISECSKILNSELKKEKYIMAVDLILLENLLKQDNYDKKQIKEVIKKVKKIMSVEIEQEKKYIFSNDLNQIDAFKIVRDSLGLVDPEYIENEDIYYDFCGILAQERIAIRKRVSNGKEEWTIKRPLKDKTSISKRDEKNFDKKEDVINFLYEEWNIEVDYLEEVVALKTYRAKYDIKYGAGDFEIVFDKTIPIIENKEYEPNYMIECELKNGNSSGLYFINEIINKFDFIEECKYSKKEVALKMIKEEKAKILKKNYN